MDLSGIIFVVLAVAWAGYLIPKALKHHDEVARTRSIDRFSTAMRVLAHREPVSRRDTRLVVSPARSADNPRVLPPAERRAELPARRPAERKAARVAARRRRRVLVFFVLADLAVGALAYLGLVLVWAPAGPVVLSVSWLILCRTQVRRERDRAWSVELAVAVAEEESAAPLAPREVVRNAQGFEEVSPDEDTVSIPAELLAAVAVPTSDGGSLWDPLPVTLPSYVGKPAARRTVRSIDLTEPGAFSAGRSAEDSALVAEASAEREAAAAEVAAEPRAVGS